MGKHYTLGCFTIWDNSGTPVATHLGATSIDLALNTEISGNDSGALYEEFQAITRVDPVATVTTKNIDLALNFIGLAGQCVGTGFAVTQCDVLTRRMEDCQNALGGAPHMRDRVSRGLLTLGALTADRGADATISLTLDAITDGVNAPVARTDGVALPSDVEANRFTLGLLGIGGADFPEVESVSIDFGVAKTEKNPSLGSIWTDAIGVLTVRPTITIRGRDLSKVAQALIAAGAGTSTHANTVIQLIKRQNAGRFVDFATAEHIKITAAGLYAPDSLLSAAAGQRATHTIRLAASYDGANAPLLFDTTWAYDTTPVGS